MALLLGGLTLCAGMSPAVAPDSALASARAPAAVTGTPLPPASQATLDKISHEPVSATPAPGRPAGTPVSPTALPPMLLPNRGNLPQNPASSTQKATPDVQRSPGTPSPLAAQTVGTKLLGATSSEAPFIPPDTMGAVGPTQYIVIVNGYIRSFKKSDGTADGFLNMPTSTFWGLSTLVSDPRIRYDRLSGRWFITMITVTPTDTANQVLIAFSGGKDITSKNDFTFRAYGVNTFHNGCLWDYDTLGIDQNALYIGGNLFCGNPRTFSSTRGLVVAKVALLGVGPPTAFDFRLLNPALGCSSPGVGADGPLDPQGVDNYDPASTEGYFAGRANCFASELSFVRIINPGGTPQNPPSGVLFVLAVAPELNVLPVPALGSTHPLEANDNRLISAHLRNGHLWTAHNICVDSSGVGTSGSCPAGARDASRWYDIINLQATPSVNQSGTVFDPAATNPRFYWMPSIMVSGQGHVAMGTSTASSAENAQAATMGRLAGDPPGTMNPAAIYQASTFVYNAQPSPTSGRQRWGDYSYTSLDPNDDMTMWTIQEFANATDSWGVEAAQLIAPPPATPASVAEPLFINRSSQTATVTGTSTNGSGFFDPGAGFANRLQASVSGGVTVNGVGYVDPTHITLDINTMAAPAGLKNLTVTNPDGQVVTVNNFINISLGKPYNPLPPKRITDTRCPSPGPNSCHALGAASILNVQVTGGAGLPPNTAIAAVLNVTAINYQGGGYLTVFPGGGTRPNASNLNLTAGGTIANLVEAPLGSGGGVSIYNESGLTDVIVDVEGYVGPNISPGSGLFHPRAPARIVDTRSQYNPPFPTGAHSLTAGSTLQVQVAGATSNTGTLNVVPPTGASAVVLNVTATGGTQGSYMTVYPADVPRPNASNLNFPAGRDVANRVIVPLSITNANGSTGPGYVKIYNDSGVTDVVVDVNGWFTDNTGTTGGVYIGLPPKRIADSRPAYNVGGFASLAPGGTVTVTVAGLADVPAMGATVPPTSVVLNVTVVGPGTAGYYTIYPADVTQPVASDLNFIGGQVVPNLVVVQLSATGTIKITNHSGGSDDFIVDVEGWYS